MSAQITPAQRNLAAIHRAAQELWQRVIARTWTMPTNAYRSADEYPGITEHAYGLVEQTPYVG